MDSNLTKQIIIILFFLSILKIQAQVDTLWTKTFGGSGDDGAYSVQQTINEGYVIVGATESFGAGNEDVWLIKTNSSGDTLWTRTFGGSNLDWGNSVQQTTDEGYIITGNTYSFGDGSKNIWLIKTNASGDTLWTKIFGGDGYEGGYSVQQTADGGYILTGYTQSFGTIGSYDIWLIKTNTSGDTLWTKTFGGYEIDWGYSVQQSSDEGFIIIGFTGSFGAGNWDIRLIKTSASGDTLWTKTYGGDAYDGGFSVQQTTDEGYIITGYTESFGAGGSDTWVIKTNASGDTLWTKTFGGIGVDCGNAIQQTTNGGYLIAGSTSSFGAGGGDVWLIKITNEVNKTIQYKGKATLDYFLYQNYTNPFNPSTTIEFSLPKTEWVTLRVFNVLGQQVTVLVSEKLNPGIHKYEWHADNLPSGIYYCRMQAGEYEQVRKMILLR